VAIFSQPTCDNSDKLSDSYDDLYVGVTFFRHMEEFRTDPVDLLRLFRSFLAHIYLFSVFATMTYYNVIGVVCFRYRIVFKQIR